MTETLSPIGFWSYARQDDEEKLSGLRSILQRQLQQKYGREPIKIFQDVAAIPPGADWNNKITEALHSSTFLIPIITPNFLESEWCNQEFFLFLEREQAIAKEFPELAASKRIFPIFYIDITDVEAFDSRLLPELRKRQWANFRDLIYKEDTHESVRLRLDQIAEGIVKVLRLDQRAIRDRKSAAAASHATAQHAGSQRLAEEPAPSEQKAREAAALRHQEEQAALAAEQAQRAATAREAAEVAERKRREEAERTVAAQLHTQAEPWRKTQLSEDQPLSQVERVVDTLIAPTKTFTDILRSTSWWLPFLISTVVAFAMAFSIGQKVGWSAVVENEIQANPRTAQQLANATPESAAAVRKEMLSIDEVELYGFSVVSLIGLLLLALILWPTIKFAFGGKATFGQVFSVLNYALLPAAIKGVIIVAALWIGSSVENFRLGNMLGTNPGYYIESAGTLKTLLTSFDVFTLWTLVLLSIGLAIVAKTKRSTGFIVVFGWWLLMLVVTTTIAAASS